MNHTQTQKILFLIEWLLTGLIAFAGFYYLRHIVALALTALFDLFLKTNVPTK